MKKENRSPIINGKSLIYLFVGFWSYLLFILTSLVTGKINQMIVDQSKNNAEQIAKVASLAQIRIVEDSKLIFENWADEIKNSTEIEQNPCQASIIRLVEKNTEHLYYGAVNLEGNILCTWVPVPEGANVKERKYFKDVLANKKLSVGEYQLGAITESPSINLAYPVIDEVGEVKLVLVLAINLDWFDQRIKNIELPNEIKLLITDYKGTILATYPKNETEEDGKPININSKLLSIILSKETGVVEGKEVGDEKNIYAFRSFGGLKEEQVSFYSIVTVSEKITIKGLQEMAILTYLVKGTFLVSGLTFSGLFFKEKRRQRSLRSI